MLTTPITLLGKLTADPGSVLWEEFYRVYRNVILRYAQKQGLDGGACEDVLQETMLAFFKCLQREGFAYDPGRGRFRNFLLTIVHRKVLDARRRTRQLSEMPLEGWLEERLGDMQGEPGAQQEADWETSLLDDAWARLCADPQTDATTVAVFQAYVRDGEDVAAVAERFGLKRNAVYQIKNRIMKRLKREVEILLEIGKKF